MTRANDTQSFKDIKYVAFLTNLHNVSMFVEPKTVLDNMKTSWKFFKFRLVEIVEIFGVFRIGLQ